MYVITSTSIPIPFAKVQGNIVSWLLLCKTGRVTQYVFFEPTLSQRNCSFLFCFWFNFSSIFFLLIEDKV